MTLTNVVLRRTLSSKVVCGVWPDQYMSYMFLQRQFDIREEEENAARNRYEERRILRLLEMT